MQATLTVYKASAGSGKTFTLAAEYIALMLMKQQDDEFQHILAVTFTNLATSEMKDRILTYLYSMAHCPQEERDFMDKVLEILDGKGCQMTEEEIQAKAQKCLVAILHDYSRFRVETIDSFFQSILHNLAHELGLNANLQVELDNAQLVDRAVDRVIENLRDDKDDRTKKTITELMEDKLLEGKSWDVPSIVKKFAQCIFDEAFQNRNDQEREALNNEQAIKTFVGDICRIREDAKREIKEAAEKARNRINSQTLDFGRISRGNYYSSFLDKIEACTLDEPSTTVQSVIDGDSHVLLRSADRDDPVLAAEAGNTAELLAETYTLYTNRYKDVNTAGIALKYIRELSLLGQIEQTIEHICEENNQFSLSKTPSLLKQLIGHEDAPFVFEKAGTQFNHVMIDEFQDTSRMQWQNFRVLLLDNLASGGHDLLVGDVKQSIYRWRNGDWRILHDIEHTTGFPAQPKVETLRTNRRSCSNIVSFNNAFFHDASHVLDSLGKNKYTIAEIYGDVKQLPKPGAEGGYVRVCLHRNIKKSDEEYQTAVAQDMIEQIRTLTNTGVSPRDIAILVRTHEDSDILIDRFSQLASDITLVSDEAFRLEASTAVQMMICALRVLGNTQQPDKLAMRYLCLHYIGARQEEHQGADIFTRREEEILPEAFIRHLDELSALPLYLLCEHLYRIFEMGKTPGQDAYLLAFFDELQACIQSGISDVSGFLNAWDESVHKHAIPSGSIEGVRILTIHKSKGLQFHTVLVPATHWHIERDMQNDKMWCHTNDETFDVLGELRIDMSKSLSKSHYAASYEEEHFQRRVDALNLLYVAFTRAEKNLMIWGRTEMDAEKEKKKEKEDKRKDKEDKNKRPALSGDLLYLFLENPPFGTVETRENLQTYSYGTIIGPCKEKQASQHRMATSGKPLIQHIESYAPNLNFRQSNESLKFIRSLDSEQETPQSYTDIGKQMHFVLSQIRTVDDIPQVLERCRATGIIEDEARLQAIIARLNEGFNNPLIKSWFSDDIEFENERNIIGQSTFQPHQSVHRPDRVVMQGNTITVIDYKFARPDAEQQAEYENQVRAYMDLLKRIHPESEVKGYLWYVYSIRLKRVFLE
ncbi:MAG: UvrD-helicase domain-containing protein [Bacteroidaceae bacterium]|nr:UvrD-helicase domain-containing protein [Bacteroidaceae bacterium]